MEKTAILFVLCILKISVTALQPEIKFYDTEDMSQVVLEISYEVSNTSALDGFVDIVSQSVRLCCTGSWRFYTEVDYGLGQDSGFLFGQGLENLEYCYIIDDIMESLSLSLSLRPLGPTDIDTQSITFYEFEAHGGQKTSILEADRPVLTFVPKSYYVTAPRTAAENPDDYPVYQLFENENFDDNGPNGCLVFRKDFRPTPVRYFENNMRNFETLQDITEIKSVRYFTSQDAVTNCVDNVMNIPFDMPPVADRLQPNSHIIAPITLDPISK